MAYCPPELLDDLADLFADARSWAGVIEKRTGIFYARNRPFLHFHLLAGGRRCEDVKGHTGDTLEECRKQLAEVVEEWLLIRRRSVVPGPSSGRHHTSRVGKRVNRRFGVNRSGTEG